LNSLRLNSELKSIED